MPADARARASTYFRLFRTWSSTSSLLFTTCVRLFLDFPQLFSSLALVGLNFPSRKLTTFRSFPEEKF